MCDEVLDPDAQTACVVKIRGKRGGSGELNAVYVRAGEGRRCCDIQRIGLDLTTTNEV
jgi:ribosomal protein S28E/S33